MKRLRFAALFVFVILAVSLEAQSFFSKLDFSLRPSLLFFPEDNGGASAPMPVLPALGGSVSWPLSDFFALEFSLDLYGTTYDYDYTLNRPVPANDEFRSSFVIGTLWGFQPVLRFRLRDGNIIVRTYGGLACDFRICLLAYGIDPGESHTDSGGATGHTVAEAAGAVFSYFWGAGRWLFPFAGGGMDFRLVDGLLLGFDVRAWFPLYRLWTGEDLPFIEGFRFGVGLRFTFA